MEIATEAILLLYFIHSAIEIWEHKKMCILLIFSLCNCAARYEYLDSQAKDHTKQLVGKLMGTTILILFVSVHCFKNGKIPTNIECFMPA